MTDKKDAPDVATPPADLDASGSIDANETVLAGTIADVTAHIATVTSLDDLKALRKAEKSGKDRVGVIDAIDKRKAEIAGAEKDAGKATGDKPVENKPAGDKPAAPAPTETAKRSTHAEIKALEASLAADQARLAELKAKRDYVEFPKMVKGHTFASREEQDKAGPEYADEV